MKGGEVCGILAAPLWELEPEPVRRPGQLGAGPLVACLLPTGIASQSQRSGLGMQSPDKLRRLCLLVPELP